MARGMKEKFDVLVERAFPSSQCQKASKVHIEEDSSYTQGSVDSRLSAGNDSIEYSTESSSEEESVDNEATSDDSYSKKVRRTNNQRKRSNPSRPQRKKTNIAKKSRVSS